MMVACTPIPVVGVWVVVYSIKHSSDKGAVGALPVLKPVILLTVHQNRGEVV